MSALSPRLAAIVDALPLRPGLRVLEIGGAPGAAAKAVADRIGDGRILVIDRSAEGAAQIRRNAAAEIEAGRLDTRQVAAEEFELLPAEAPFDIAFAVRVGALDGRHPKAGAIARRRIAAALTPNGRLFIDGGNPLREIELLCPTEPDSTADGFRADALGSAPSGSRRRSGRLPARPKGGRRTAPTGIFAPNATPALRGPGESGGIERRP